MGRAPNRDKSAAQALMPKPKNGKHALPDGLIRCVIYVRVSTEAQGERVSPEVQLAESETYARSHGYPIVAVYKDCERYRVKGRMVEPSAERIDRPDFKRLLADGYANKYDVIIGWKEDRIYRGVRPAVLIDDLLEGSHVDIELVKETFDRKMLFIKAAIGKIELDNIRQRTEMGHRERVRGGLIHGGPVPGGFVPVRASEGAAVGYVLDPDWRPFFDDLAHMFVARVSVVEIARRLGPNPRSGKPWYPQTLINMLRNPFYRGRLAYGWQSGNPDFVVAGKHDAVWDSATCDAIDRELVRRGGRNNAPRSRALWSGILHCGACGRPMATLISNNVYRAYGCYRPVMVRQGTWAGRRTHEPNYINERPLMKLVKAAFAGLTPADVDRQIAALSEVTGGPVADDSARRARLEAEAEQLRAKLADLAVGLEGVRHASPSATEALISAITTAGRSLDRVRADLAGLEQKRTAAPDLERARESMLHFIQHPEAFDLQPAELQSLLQQAIPALYVRRGELAPPIAPWED
jgi:DNA invertase Pin-like site-specific DNA recombinase